MPIITSQEIYLQLRELSKPARHALIPANTFGGINLITSNLFPFVQTCSKCAGTGEGLDSTYCPKCQGGGGIKYLGVMTDYNKVPIQTFTERLPHKFFPSFPGYVDTPRKIERYQ